MTDNLPAAGAAPTVEKRRLPAIPLWAALVLMIVALAAAVLVLDRVVEPLYGLVFSRGIPVPDGASEVEHVKPDKGAVYWIFRTDQSGHEVAAFYEDAGGKCVYAAASGEPEGPARERSVAHCIGRQQSAARGSGWEVFIAEGYPAEDGPTVFRVYEY